MGRKKYDLKKSKEQIGVIHPAIKSKLSGNIVAGKDRLKADPSWPIEERDFKNREEELLFQIADNTRRKITMEERTQEFQELYNINKSKDIPEHKIIPYIASETGFAEQYVRRLLKNEPQVRKSKSKKEIEEGIISEYLDLHFLPRAVLLNAYTKLGQQTFTDLVKRFKDYYTSVTESNVKAKVLNGSLSELLEVTYAELEKVDFAKQDENSMRYWKYLAEEYLKRHKEG